MEVPGLHKVRLHDLKPPEELSNEDHDVILRDTMIRVNTIHDNVLFYNFLLLRCFSGSPLVLSESTAGPRASDRSICSGIHEKTLVVAGCCTYCLLWRAHPSDRYLHRTRKQGVFKSTSYEGAERNIFGILENEHVLLLTTKLLK